jgi:hypothetical protein
MPLKLHSALLILILLVAWASPPPPARAAADAPKTLFVDMNRAITDQQVAAAVWDDTDLTHVLRDGFMNTVSTSSGSGVSFSNTLPPAITRSNLKSLNVPAAGDFVEIADHAALNSLSTSFTVAAWIKRSTLNVGATIYDSGTQTGHWFVGLLSNNKLAFTTNGITDYVSAHTINDTNWHHVAFVVNTGQVSIFLDGVPDTLQAISPLNTPSGPKLIGNKQSKTTGFRGLIEELRLYNRALSSAEISRLATGKGCAQEGLSWAEAFPDLQCALDVAASGDQIWVARGVYRPGPAAAATFAGKSGVKLYGGLLGVETSLSQRPDFNQPSSVTASPLSYTILSGDVDGDDNPATFANYGDNNRFVVTNLGVNSAAAWDGFVIRGGASNLVPALAPGVEPEAGGGMFNFNSSITLLNLAFLANRGERSNYGGGLTNVNSNISLSTTTFLGNKGFAGGMYATGLAPSLMLTRFEGNQGTGSSGGLAVQDGGLNLSYSQFSSNTTPGKGGGLSSDGGEIVVYAVDFDDNLASLGGGGIYITGTVATLSEIDLTGNTTTSGSGGGGLAAVKGTLTMSDSTLQENSAGSSFGGGLLIDGTSATLDRMRLLGNIAAAGGGAISAINTNSVKVFNSLLVGNGGSLNQPGNALNVGAANLKLVNCTFSNNVNSSSAHLGRVSFNGVLTILNSILWDHDSTLLEIASPATAIVNADLIGRPGVGNDPRFYQYPTPGDGDWSTPAGNFYGDLRLQPASPAIDAGSNVLLEAGITLDAAFSPRFFDVPFRPNTGVGAPPIDMGAFEAQFAQQVFMPLILR